MPLPIPLHEVHYADPLANEGAQLLGDFPIFVDHLCYPTLGAPALLDAQDTLDALVVLPEGEAPGSITLTLVDRHGGAPDVPLTLTGDAVDLGDSPTGSGRTAWHVRASLAGVPERLYDLRLRSASADETQPNSVRVFPPITGDERVVFCGDSQTHIENLACLDRFVERMNALPDVAWIALIGDVCDNSVKGPLQVFHTGLHIVEKDVLSHYRDEYPAAHARLRALNKPVVLVPGNHDGMAAFERYRPGVASTVYLGPDPANRVAYDGLHHFRRTFGPLYHELKWGKTRYFCANSFELDRSQRLGFEAVVTNWGGWMRPEQVGWLADGLRRATDQGEHKVVLVHHDPRGGSEGALLGEYSDFRPYNFHHGLDFLLGYARYLSTWGRRHRFQQEWMRRANEPLDDHPVRKLLGLLLDHRVWAVIMGHDNENWVESYFPGDGIFSTDPAVAQYAPEALEADGEKVLAVQQLLEDGNGEEAEALLSRMPEDEATRTLEAALGRLEASGRLSTPVSYAPSEVLAWGLRATSPIHFTHVDDVGAYKHSKAKDFEAYGYVVATLQEGRPISLRRFDLATGAARPSIDLPEKPKDEG